MRPRLHVAIPRLWMLGWVARRPVTLLGFFVLGPRFPLCAGDHVPISLTADLRWTGPGGGWAFHRPARQPPGGEPRLPQECTAGSSVPSHSLTVSKVPITVTPPLPWPCTVAV